MKNSRLKKQTFQALPKRALLTPGRDFQQSALRRISDSESDGARSKQLFIADAIPLSVRENCAIAGPAVGAPAASLIIETLVASGVQEIILLGACGGLLGEQMKIGDLIFPRSFLFEEVQGAVCSEGEWEVAAFQIHLEQAVTKSGVEPSNPFVGKVWTTHFPSDETSQKVEQFRQRACIAVEMEYAATAKAARELGVRFAAAFVISDIIGANAKRGFRSDIFKKSRDSIIQAAITC